MNDVIVPDIQLAQNVGALGSLVSIFQELLLDGNKELVLISEGSSEMTRSHDLLQM